MVLSQIFGKRQNPENDISKYLSFVVFYCDNELCMSGIADKSDKTIFTSPDSFGSVSYS